MARQRRTINRQQVEDFVNDASRAWKSEETSVWPESKLLSTTMPRIAPIAWKEAIGQRIVYWPDGCCENFRVSILSSRLGKRKDLKTWWFDGLRTTLLRCDFENDCVCVVDGTAPAEYSARGSELFGLRRLRISVSDEEPMDCNGLIDWIVQAHESAASEPSSELETRAIISPELTLPDGCNVASTEPPIVDRILVMLGERLVVLHSRLKGNVERLVKERLGQKSFEPPIVLLAAANDSPAPSAELIDAGAVLWFLDGSGTASTADPNLDPNGREAAVAINDGPLDSPDEWLCHWTRPSYGPWLDQPSEDFLDELILGCDSADRSALASLMRIVAQRRVLATVATVGEPPTVSFTAVPLKQFRQHKVFRKHRQRYDFEPWGIAVRKQTLIEKGCAAVRYIDDSDGNRPTAIDDESPFTQRRFDQNKKIDWSIEREWRLAGPLQIDNVASTDLCYFVNTVEEANRLRKECQAAVIVVPDSG